MRGLPSKLSSGRGDKGGNGGWGGCGGIYGGDGGEGGCGGGCGGCGGCGGGDGGDGGVKGQTVWQTYLFEPRHQASFQEAVLEMPNAKQSSPPELLGSPLYQFVYDSGVLDELHTHVPSDAASVPPVHTSLPLAAVSSSTFCAADCTLASCRPAA
eukprot:scaffold85756_cov55-Phaeocystis_antarctica.AAC.1